MYLQETSQTRINRMTPSHKPFIQGQFIIINTLNKPSTGRAAKRILDGEFSEKAYEQRGSFVPCSHTPFPPGWAFVQGNSFRYLCASALNRHGEIRGSVLLPVRYWAPEQWVLTFYSRHEMDGSPDATPFSHT